MRKWYQAESESDLHTSVAAYLRAKYPQVVFRTDFAAGIKMTKPQAARHKRLQHGRAYPDLFIAEPRAQYMFPINGEEKVSFAQKWYEVVELGVDISRPEDRTKKILFSGLYLELKRADTVLIRPKDAKKVLKDDYKLRRTGDWFDLHIEEQANTLELLRKKGYKAEFAVGYNQAIELIDHYLKT